MARAILLIIDSFGIGALPDAGQYGDEGANTALSICSHIRKPEWPWLTRLGLGNCASLLGHILPGCEPVEQPMASYGVMAEKSAGKDTTTGHWELAGLVLDQPFTTFKPAFPSFPAELTDALMAETGYDILGNCSASGTAIIEELGQQHLNGKGLIVYTSADSVLQIAAHNDIVSVNELYGICEKARRLCDAYNVGRVIARPFTGQPGNFIRTRERKDFSMQPTGPTILNHLQDNGVETVAIGKIGDIFSEQGISTSHHDAGNTACIDRTLNELKKQAGHNRFLFVNLVDTDMHYGHRRDIAGYHKAICEIDKALPELIGLLADDDLLLISADHGCDPGFTGTDHTREYVPLLSYSNEFGARNLGIRTSFCDVAQSLAAFFSLSPIKQGHSFY